MKTLLKTLFLGLLLGYSMDGFCQSGGSRISSTPIWDGTPFPARLGAKPIDRQNGDVKIQGAKAGPIGSRDPDMQLDGATHGSSKTTVAAQVTVQRSFTGNNLDVYTPGDNTMGISNGGYIVSVDNYTIDYYTDTPDTLKQFQQHHTFYGDSALRGVPFDPRVTYDRYANRFIVVMMAYADSMDDYLLISFSRDEDPRNGWNHYRLRSDSLDENQWLDYINVAVNRDELFITGNLYGDAAGSAQSGNKVFQIRKAEGYLGSPLKWREWRNTLDFEGDMAYSMVPLQDGLMRDSYNKGIYLVSTKNLAPGDSSNKLLWYQITDSFNAPAVAFDLHMTNSLIYYSDPFVGLQLGIGYPIKISDSKVHSGFFMDSILNFVYCRNYNNYSVVVLNRLDLRTNTVQRYPWGNTNSQMDFTFPSIAFYGADSTDNDNLILFYARTASNFFPQLATVNFDDGAFWPNSTIVRQGDGYIDFYGGSQNERWGDYTTIQRRYDSQPPRCWAVGGYPFGATPNFFGSTNGLNAFIAEIGDSIALGAVDVQALNPTAMVYPNPSHGNFTVLSSNPRHRVTGIALIDLAGHLLYDHECQPSQELQVSIPVLPEGMYLLKIEYNHQNVSYEKLLVRFND